MLSCLRAPRGQCRLPPGTQWTEHTPTHHYEQMRTHGSFIGAVAQVDSGGDDEGGEGDRNMQKVKSQSEFVARWVRTLSNQVNGRGWGFLHQWVHQIHYE